jgi:peptidoglycan/LPS O-acetylase OafA/YrhL
MYHMIANGLVHGLFGTGRGSLDTPAGVALSVAALALTLALAAVSYYLFERPIFMWGQRFKYHRPKEEVAGVDGVPVPVHPAPSLVGG